MKIPLLALPALLSALVVAGPSPPSRFQQPLQSQTAPRTSQWRSLSDRLIGTLFGIEGKVKSAAGNGHAIWDKPSRPPPHTLARYEGDVVLRFNISTADEATALREAANTLLLDVWDTTRNWVDIRLSTSILPSLLGLLPPTLQQAHTPLLHERDLAQAIYDTYPQPATPQSPHSAAPQPPLHDRGFSPALHPTTNAGDTNLMFRDYQPLSVLHPWMRFLASFFTTHVRLLTIGHSYEGRPILGLRIGVHPTNNQDPNPPKRKTILVTAGLHAREWISTSTAAYLAFHLTTSYGKNPTVTALLEHFDFVVIPTLNPDGYEYTWSTDRLWRKNRQSTSVRFCPGIDLDRGFGFEWDAAGNPCSENYAGGEPWEAVESKVLGEWARNASEGSGEGRAGVEFVSLVDLHSYSQEILYPYSYSCAVTPPGQENLEELAVGLAKAIRISSGKNYDVLAACEGNVAPTGEPRNEAQRGTSSGASRVNGGKKDKALLPLVESQGGSALDWFYHDLRVKYAYQIKLRDRGTYGFLLPRTEIVPSGREAVEAVGYLGQFLMEEMFGEEVVDDQGESVAGEDDGESRGERDGGEEWVVVEDVDTDMDMDVREGEGEAEPQFELRRRRKR